MKYLIFIAILIFTNLSIAQTHLITFAACPPWKKIIGQPDITQKMAQACKLDTENIQRSFQVAFNIPKKNIHQHLNETATYKDVTNTLTRLSQTIKPEDTVFIYINAHADIINSLYRGYSVHDESIAWYSKNQPDASKTADSSTGIMNIRTLRDLIDDIPAKQKVTIIDVCHAAGGIDDFKTDIAYAGVNGGKQAIIFSAEKDQIANFTANMKNALFTENLSRALLSGKYKNLTDAFLSARINTHRQARNQCMEGHSLKEMLKNSDDYLKACTQKPISFDPFGLMDSLTLKNVKKVVQ